MAKLPSWSSGVAFNRRRRVDQRQASSTPVIPKPSCPRLRQAALRLAGKCRAPAKPRCLPLRSTPAPCHSSLTPQLADLGCWGNDGTWIACTRTREVDQSRQSKMRDNNGSCLSPLSYSASNVSRPGEDGAVGNCIQPSLFWANSFSESRAFLPGGTRHAARSTMGEIVLIMTSREGCPDWGRCRASRGHGSPLKTPLGPSRGHIQTRLG
ncbi:hypothetical protein VTK56DRAFT_4085 [Thermocarpiscus australiensis]